MVSNTHEDGQIVVSEKITLTSPPRNTYGSNNAESSYSNISAFSKNEEQLKSSVQHDNDNIINKGVVAENLPSVNENDLYVEAIAVDNENDQLSHIEKEMIVCDTCGDLGYEDLLVICSKCKVGAEHTYCMVVKVDVPPKEWICYDCTEDRDGVPEGEETSSMERRVESSIDFFKMEERTLSQEQPDLLSTNLNIDLNADPNNIDLNADPNRDMNEEPSSRKRKIGPSDDLSKANHNTTHICKICFYEPKLTEEASSQADLLSRRSRPRMGLDLNKEPNPDFDEDPNIGLM
uniref:PHD-type domain-containing protein n=1 Tax=Brassica oleracea var. oleracea TaxID=109376 RepID=A0A0D3A3X4_BRAOL